MRTRHMTILLATLVLGMGVAAAQDNAAAGQDNAATTQDATSTAPATGAESTLQRFVIERDIANRITPVVTVIDPTTASAP